MKEIKKLRIAAKVKQVDLANMLKIGQENFSNIENGRLVPISIEDIKTRCVKILMPYLETEILKAEFEVNYLKKIKKDISK